MSLRGHSTFSVENLNNFIRTDKLMKIFFLTLGSLERLNKKINIFRKIMIVSTVQLGSSIKEFSIRALPLIRDRVEALFLRDPLTFRASELFCREWGYLISQYTLTLPPIQPREHCY